MSEAAREKGLVPKLRFPEFRKENQPWATCRLSEVTASINAGLSADQQNRKTEFPVTRIETISDGSINLQRVGFVHHFVGIEAYKLKPGDILISNINSTEHIGKSVRFDISTPLYHGMNLLRIMPKTSEMLSEFLSFQLSTKQVRSDLQARSNKAVNQASINQTALGTTILAKPTLSEQRKIAECLQSLDELIAAETEKLEALKRHKKGLLQQLFPAEGETTPRRRFPQFRNSSKWQEKELRAIALYQNGKAYEQHIDSSGKYVVVNAGFIASDGRSRKYSGEDFLIARENDILMVLSDLPNGAALAKCFLVDADAKYAVNQRVAIIRPLHADACFLHSVLDRAPKLLAYNDGMNQTHLSKDSVESLRILMPDEDEQRAVSLCLSFANAQVETMTDVLVQLRTHKAALMQQLFPTLDETEQ